MSQEATDMEPYHKEILEMKQDIKTLEKDVQDLKIKDTRHDERLSAIDKTLDGIADDTKWIKRTITTAIIGAICTGVIGGAIALIYANL